MQSATIGREGPRVGVRNEAGAGCAMEWPAALAFGRLVQYMARGALGPEPERAGPLVVRRDGDDLVIATTAGAVLFSWPVRAAVEIGNAIIGTAHEAESEEEAIADAIARDHALLWRLGVNLGLTDHPALVREAANLAAWDSRLRRAIPSSGRLRQHHVGTPRVQRQNQQNRQREKGSCPTTT